MKKYLLVGYSLIVNLFLFTFTELSFAELLLTMSSSLQPSTLNVGETVTVEVHLVGIEMGQELDSLAVDVSIDDTVFTDLIDPIAGPAVVPSSETDFDPFSFADSDLITGAFLLDSAMSGITTNGLFFSFTMTATNPGTGTIGFVPGSALAVTNGDDFLPVTEGDPLQFTVVVPEPTTLAVLGLGTMLGVRVRRNAVASM